MNFGFAKQGRPGLGGRQANQRPELYRIEGDTVSMSDIAKRLGISESAARSRLKKLRGASGAIDWRRLEAFGK